MVKCAGAHLFRGPEAAQNAPLHNKDQGAGDVNCRVSDVGEAQRVLDSGTASFHMGKQKAFHLILGRTRPRRGIETSR